MVITSFHTLCGSGLQDDKRITFTITKDEVSGDVQAAYVSHGTTLLECDIRDARTWYKRYLGMGFTPLRA